MSNSIDLDIPDDAWEADDRKPPALWISVWIGGTGHHLQAIPIEVVDDEQRGAGEWDEYLEGLVLAFVSDGHFETTTIRGRTYAIFMEPFC